MQFNSELWKVLQRNQYGIVQENRSDVWVKMTEQEMQCIHLLPETLPGQPKLTTEEIIRQQEALGNAWMIKTGKPVKWLTMMVLQDLPDQEIRKNAESYRNLWCISRQQNKVMVYENQDTIFDPLLPQIEEMMEGYRSNEKIRNKQRLNTFTPVNTAIVFLNILVFLILSMLGDVEDAGFMAEHGGMVWDAIVHGREYYRLFSSMFLHFGADHLFQNMLILLLMGSRLERIIGKGPYFFIYLGSGLIASFSSLFFTLQADPYTVSGGASGAIFGVLGAVLAMVLKDLLLGNRKRISDVGITGIIFMIGSALSYGFLETSVDNAAHVGGLLAGFMLAMIFSLIIDRKMDR